MTFRKDRFYMPDRPFGFDTLDVPAFLATEGDDALGFDAVKIPAILVPEGGDPPGGDWVNVGAVVRPIAEAKPSPASPRDQPPMQPRNTGTMPPNPTSDKDPIIAGMKALRATAPKRAAAQSSR